MSETQPSRFEVLRRYIIASLVLNGAWEIGHLPLYTLWTTGTPAERWYAIVHCTLGDVMIAGSTLVLALILGRARQWPTEGSRRVWLLTVLLGVGYTIFSEWLNVHLRGSWAYAPAMPLLPITGTGISPLVQWLIVPTLALGFAEWRAPWSAEKRA